MPAMQLNPYLSFKGNCEVAFKFYERCLGGRIGNIFRYAGSPMATDVPADWQDKVMHGTITIGDHVLMAADVTSDRYQEPRGFSLSLHMAIANDAERIFAELAREGSITVPLQRTFWAERFGMVIDHFGISWLINGG